MPEVTGAPYPKYLLRTDARAVIAAIEAEGYSIDLRVPAIGSVSITITTPDGKSRTELGNVERLVEALTTVAQHCGIDFEVE